MAKHDLIIGLDFGHGEVAAHCIRSNVIEPLTLNSAKDKCMMTALAYGDEGRVFIGPEAANLDTVVAYFKASPEEWDEVYEGGHTKQALIHDFIQQLFAQIREFNAPLDITIDPEKTLLLVGCPTSGVWMSPEANKAYADLLREATGIADVVVLPESRAAIFSAFHQVKGLKLDTTKGVAVFDFGSSTADFTYYLLGQKRYEFNCRLGAAQIEQVIVSRLMEQLQANVVSGVVNSKELEVRKLKEAFFTAVQNGQVYDRAIALDFLKAGYDGKPIAVGTNRRTGKPIYDKVTVAGKMDDETVVWATEQCRFALPEDPARTKRTWYGHCEHFFEEAKRYLDNNDLPCETIVLTGGASKMDFVRELCKKTFPAQAEADRIHVEENPSYSVSIGLCYLSHGQETMQDLLEAGKQKLRSDLRGNVDTMVAGIANEMADLYYDYTCRAMEGLSGDVTVGVLTDAIMGNLQKVPQEKLENIVASYSLKWKNGAAQTLRNYARDIVKEMYPGLEGSFDADISQQYLESILKTLNISLDATSVLSGVDMVSDLLKIAVSIATGLILLVLFGVLEIIPLLGPIIAVFAGPYIAELLTEWIARNRDFKLGKAAKITERYKKKRGENLQKMSEEIKTKVKGQLTEQMGSDYTNYLDQMEAAAQAAVEIMSLQSFPEDQQ